MVGLESTETKAQRLVNTYNPALGRHHLMTPSEWEQVGELVRRLVTPFTDLRGEQIRDYLRAAAKLCVWVLRLDGEMSTESVLTTRVVEGYLRSVPQGAPDEAPYLWRLAHRHGVANDVAPSARQVARRPLTSPYTSQELATLLAEAQAQPTELRRATLLAIIVLGAGCGLVRESSRDVCAADVHQHADGMFVRSASRCTKVLPEFEERLSELTRLRPSGRLLGAVQPRFVTQQAHRWLDGRSGIPHLSVDSLRARYIVAALHSSATVLEVLAWTGLRSPAALWRYAEGLEGPSTCPRTLAL